MDQTPRSAPEGATPVPPVGLVNPAELAQMANPVNKEPDPRWRAWHLHLDTENRSARDRVVTEVLPAATAAAPGKPWFFIRYWHGGPHIRFRMRDLSEDEAGLVEKELGAALASAGQLREGEEPLSAEEYEQATSKLIAAGDQPTHDEVQGLLPAGVHSFGYHPETERYGGEALMPATERLFQLSSELCLAFLRRNPSDNARATLALRATLAAGRAIDAAAGTSEESTSSALFYALGLYSWNAWATGAGHSEEQLQQASQSKVAPSAVPDDPGPLASWQAELTALASEVQQQTGELPGLVLSSHVHMLHNRLGLPVLEEVRTYARLSHLFPNSTPLDFPEDDAHPLPKEHQ